HVKRSERRPRDSHVLHARSGRSLSYFELAAKAARLRAPANDAIVLKKPSDFTLLGQRISGVDNHALVTGQPLFGIDQLLPGMRYAVYQKCPATGGSVVTANLDEIQKIPGVGDAFVLQGNGNTRRLRPGASIIAAHTWAALNAKRQLNIEGDESGRAKGSWSKSVAAAADAMKGQGQDIVADKGAVDDAFAAAAATIEAQYSYAFVSHAQLEPQNCTAWYRDGAIELWAPTQTPQRGATSVASMLSLAAEKVTVHQTRVGGGFGRRLT